MKESLLEMKLVTVVFLALALLSPLARSADIEITNLYDAFGEEIDGVHQDFGLSLFIKYGDKTILFDAGTNADVLKRNATALGVDLSEVDFAVASHAHADHTGGFHYLLRVNPDVTIYYPNDFFGASAPLSFDISGKEPGVAEKLPARQKYFGGASTEANLKSNGAYYNAIEYVSENTRLAEGIQLIATSSPYIGYFTKYPGIDLHGNPVAGDSADASFLGLPELSLSLSTAAGEYLFVGCSHSTVEVIVKEARDVLGRDIHFLVGGYHLLPYDRETIDDIAARLRNDLNVENIAPAHCTGHLAFQVLKENFGANYTFFGLGSEIRGD